MFFVVRSNDSFNFPLGLIKYIVIVIIVIQVPNTCPRRQAARGHLFVCFLKPFGHMPSIWDTDIHTEATRSSVCAFSLGSSYLTIRPNRLPKTWELLQGTYVLPKKGVHPQCGMNTGSSSEVTTELLQGTYVLPKRECILNVGWTQVLAQKSQQSCYKVLMYSQKGVHPQ